jgi:hypothetical protein
MKSSSFFCNQKQSIAYNFLGEILDKLKVVENERANILRYSFSTKINENPETRRKLSNFIKKKTFLVLVPNYMLGRVI